MKGFASTVASACSGKVQALLKRYAQHPAPILSKKIQRRGSQTQDRYESRVPNVQRGGRRDRRPRRWRVASWEAPSLKEPKHVIHVWSLPPIEHGLLHRETRILKESTGESGGCMDLLSKLRELPHPFSEEDILGGRGRRCGMAMRPCAGKEDDSE
jgi:hypothetical protein